MGIKISWVGLTVLLAGPVLITGLAQGFAIAGAIILVIGVVFQLLDK